MDFLWNHTLEFYMQLLQVSDTCNKFLDFFFLEFSGQLNISKKNKYKYIVNAYFIYTHLCLFLCLLLVAHLKAMDITDVFVFCSPGEMVRQVIINVLSSGKYPYSLYRRFFVLQPPPFPQEIPVYIHAMLLSI